MVFCCGGRRKLLDLGLLDGVTGVRVCSLVLWRFTFLRRRVGGMRGVQMISRIDRIMAEIKEPNIFLLIFGLRTAGKHFRFLVLPALLTVFV